MGGGGMRRCRQAGVKGLLAAIFYGVKSDKMFTMASYS